MKHHQLLIGIIALSCILIPACSQDDFLNPSDSAANAAANKDIKETMGGEDIFNVSKSGMDVSVPAASPGLQGSVSSTVTASVAGQWHLEMTDSTARLADVMIYQSGDVIFGRGTMAVGDATQDVAATGFISGNEITLDLLVMGDLNLFSLDLELNGKSLSGGYMGYSASAEPWLGIVVGSLSA